MKKLILLLFVQFSLSQGTLMLDQEKSKISYDAKHFLHAWSGHNNSIKGVMITEGDVISNIAVAAEIVNFDSGNSNRDAHSLEVLEALKFPMIKYYSDNIKINDEVVIINGKLEFHGEEKNIIVNSTISENDEEIILKGTFQVKPTEFLIKLPSFMLAEIRDLITVKFDLYFKK
jgi:polyisoprenoid-binding protein YceI